MDQKDPCLADKPVDTRNFFLACYAVSLVQGQTIQGGNIRYRTLCHYINDARRLFSRRQIATRSIDCEDYIAIILRTVKNYEKVPNRRNMITDHMFVWLHNKAQKMHQDSALAAIVDWLILGRYTGFRKAEWCQSTQTTFERIEEWPEQPPLAFILSDFTLLGNLEKRIHNFHKKSYKELLQIVKHLKIKWRKQKNGDNGQEILYSRDYANPWLCPVLAGIRIILRALRLKVPANEPIAVFQNDKQQRRFITDNQVAKYLRSAAGSVMDITKKEELQLWSTHSLRVTAANLLHRERFADSYIQTRLRWKSNSFLMYLRNTIYAADQHTAGMKLAESNLPPLVERSYREAEPHEAIILAPAA